MPTRALHSRPHLLGRAIALFRRHDEETLEAQYAVHHDENLLVQTTREAAEELKGLFEADAIRPLATLESNASR